MEDISGINYTSILASYSTKSEFLLNCKKRTLILGGSPVVSQLGKEFAMLHLNSHRQRRAIVPNFRRNSREPLITLYRNQISHLGLLSRTLYNYGTKPDPTSPTVLTVDSIRLLCNGSSAQHYNLTSPLIPSEDRELVEN